MHHTIARSGIDEEVDEARPGDLGAGDKSGGVERGHDGLRQLARIALERFGEDQGEVAGEVAMTDLARAFEQRDDSADVKPGRGDGARQHIGQSLPEFWKGGHVRGQRGERL